MNATADEAQEGAYGRLGSPGFDIRWIMPEGFFEIPMDSESLDETAEQLIELARSVMPEATFEVQLEWAMMVAAHYDSFVESGIQYSGFVLTEVDGARCVATVSVSMTDLDERAGPEPVGFLGSAMRHLGIGHVSEIELPCGPAVACIGTRKASLPGGLTSSGADEPVVTSFIQVQIPVSNGTVVVLEMGTPTQQGWDTFSAMFAGVVKSLAFFDESGELVVMSG